MGSDSNKPGFIGRIWRALTSPSARWSILALLLIGAIGGAVAVVSTQIMVYATGSDEFCGGACHSMQWVAAEHKASSHGVNSQGLSAKCSDCHIPHAYPEVLWYKAVAGTRDVYHEMKGTISTEEKFKKERLRLAEAVWTEFRATDSANCRSCHAMTPEVLAQQKVVARKAHERRFASKETCIDCHKGVAHDEPES